MSGLVERLRVLHREGHRDPIPDLLVDPRFDGSDARDAAVLAAITDRPRPGFILTHRPSNMRAHPGQVAFPGGKLDPGEDAVGAALREAWEELGIQPEHVTVIGASDLFVTGSGYAVTPIIAVIPPDLPFAPNPAEVADWFEVPVDWVFDPANHVHREVEWQGAMRHTIDMDYNGHRIWGITAAIIANLSRRIAWAAA